ncbi:MAG: cob(I)yrinic acid a,c-diamide adenosyltransferase [endosymbiont of Galathealinum brachiosum]|uniref:Corrinoid adenosyltransferase n=1 Tax=endosymbiont of Galathealinum brachiosum TaxID=2200906 RepID=A0A370D9J8_9GAMM|nr:MAG: cob(I)yrinic acid a,c-diamide adenosyltransferase [endosymbiont of Galathealinum brachiosum]
MGYRLSKIYTRKGDSGTTGMADGSRVAKDSLRMHAIGDLDELNSMLGVVVNKCQPGEVRENMITIQHDLFNLGGELVMPDYEKINQSRIDWLESTLDEMNEKLQPLKEFILPGGGEAACFCHMARTICRRTERVMVSLNSETVIKTELLAYVNRLSDWLFVASRIMNQIDDEAEVYWQSDRLNN